MKFTRRDFLKNGPITALALLLGLKPDKIIYSPVVDLPVRNVSVMFDGDFLEAVPHDPEQIARAFRPHWPAIYGDDALYGQMAGGGKTPQLEDMIDDFAPNGGFLVPPDMVKQLLLVTARELEFLNGDPRFHCRGVLVVKGDTHV